MNVFLSQKIFINPAIIERDSAAYTVQFASKVNTRAFGNVAIHQLNGGFQLRNKNKIQAIRIQVSGEKEGPYISKTSAYFNYVIKIPITQNAYLGMGASLGFTSSFVDASSVSIYSNYLLPDANFGLNLSRKKSSFGLSSFQAFNNSISGYNDFMRLSRYYQGVFETEKTLSLDYDLLFNSRLRYCTDIASQWSNSIEVKYQKAFGLGALYQTKKGMSAFLTCNQFVKEQEIQLLFAYNSGLFAKQASVFQSLELSLSMFLY